MHSTPWKSYHGTHEWPLWPPRSPDLTPLDFFWWGYIKCQVFKQPPANVAELRQRTSDEFGEVRMVRRVMRGMRTRNKVHRTS